MARQQTSDLAVLLVEHGEIDIEITKRALLSSGVPVRLRIARDGEEALDILFRSRQRNGDGQDARPPSLILLDLRLPGFDGHQLLRRVKSDPDLCSIPVAVLAEATDERTVLKCMELGGNICFAKPITVRDVKNLLRATQQYWRVMEGLRRAA